MKFLLWVVVLCTGLAATASAEAERVITTSGMGTVEAVPDMATINLGVTQQARLAVDALDATSTAVRAILDRIEAAGIAPRDVQTSDLSLQPVWSRPDGTNNSPPRVTGYVARNALSIRVRDLDGLGAVLDAVVDDGANTFNGLQFSLQDPEPAIAAARAEAVRDAMARAGQLAEAAGVTLGPVRSISESGGGFRPQMMEMASARMASDVPVASGEVSLSAQVTMVFEIVQ